MHQLNFNYSASLKHLTVTVRDRETSQIIEIVQYQDKGSAGFDFKLERSATERLTWRVGEEPLIRLASLAAAARLAYVNTLSEAEKFILAHSAPDREEDDVRWLFNGIDKNYSMGSGELTQLDPWLDLYSTEQPYQITH